MKQLFYIFCLFFLCPGSSLQAQYQSFFGTERTSWNHHTELVGPGSAIFYTDSIVLNHDTLIAGIEYRALGRYYGAPSNSLYYTGHVREDTVTGRLWYLELPDTQEILIVDMSLQIGDSFYYHPYADNSSGNPWIYADSVYYLQGRKHIRFDIAPFTYQIISQNPLEKLLFIEGVGSTVGINLGIKTYGNYLLCQKKNDTLFYANNLFQGLCNLTQINSINPIADTPPRLLMYPNPAKDYINVLISGNCTYDIYFINTFGQILHQQQIVPDQEINVRTDGFPQGVYYVLLYRKQELIVAKKIFIH